MTQFGNQNQDGMTTDYSAAVSDDVQHASAEGVYASERDLLDAYGNPAIPPDVLIEDAGRFYTALPLDAFSKAAAGHERVQTYALPTPSFAPVQILRKNPGRREAKIRLSSSTANGAVFYAPHANALSSLQNTGALLGNYAGSSPGMFQGPWGIIDLTVVSGNLSFDWNNTGDLWMVSPFAPATAQLYVVVMEAFDA